MWLWFWTKMWIWTSPELKQARGTWTVAAATRRRKNSAPGRKAGTSRVKTWKLQKFHNRTLDQDPWVWHQVGRSVLFQEEKNNQWMWMWIWAATQKHNTSYSTLCTRKKNINCSFRIINVFRKWLCRKNSLLIGNKSQLLISLCQLSTYHRMFHNFQKNYLFM